jgi:hypothetical protein
MPRRSWRCWVTLMASPTSRSRRPTAGGGWPIENLRRHCVPVDDDLRGRDIRALVGGKDGHGLYPGDRTAHRGDTGADFRLALVASQSKSATRAIARPRLCRGDLATRTPESRHRVACRPARSKAEPVFDGHPAIPRSGSRGSAAPCVVEPRLVTAPTSAGYSRSAARQRVIESLLRCPATGRRPEE